MIIKEYYFRGFNRSFKTSISKVLNRKRLFLLHTSLYFNLLYCNPVNSNVEFEKMEFKHFKK